VHAQADVCNDNGKLVAIEYTRPTAEAEVRAFIEPVGASISCIGSGATTCYVVEVPDCCEAMQYFADSGAQATILAARDPCSCRVTAP
jgi:hypothetical protein